MVEQQAFVEYLREHAYSTTTTKIYRTLLQRFTGWLERDGRPAPHEISADDALEFAATLPPTSRVPFRAALMVYWRSLGRDTADLEDDLLAGGRPVSAPTRRGARARARLERWLVLRGYSARTGRLYAGMVYRLECWLEERGAPPLGRCSADAVLEFAASLPNTYASRENFKHAVKAYYRGPLGKKSGPTPVDELRSPPRPEMECKALEPEEIAVFLQTARDEGPAAYAAMCLMYYTVLRREEAASLEWTHIGEDGWLNVRGKGAKDGRIPMHPELIGALEAQRRQVVRRRATKWVFPGRSPNSHVSVSTINTWVRLVGAAAGLGRVTPHQLRHTGGATMHDATGDLRATAKFMRHSMNSLSITTGYTRTRARRLVEMSETLTLDGKPRLTLVQEEPADGA